MPKAIQRRYQCVKYNGIDPIDAHVGQRIRERRTVLGMSMGKLSEILGPSYQQIQKYERGNNRVSASMLMKMSQALNVPVAFFFEGLDQPAMPKQGDIATRANLELMHNIAFLPDELKSYVQDMARILAHHFGRAYQRKAA